MRGRLRAASARATAGRGVPGTLWPWPRSPGLLLLLQRCRCATHTDPRINRTPPQPPRNAWRKASGLPLLTRPCRRVCNPLLVCPSLGGEGRGFAAALPCAGCPLGSRAGEPGQGCSCTSTKRGGGRTGAGWWSWLVSRGEKQFCCCCQKCWFWGWVCFCLFCLVLFILFVLWLLLCFVVLFLFILKVYTAPIVPETGTLRALEDQRSADTWPPPAPNTSRYSNALLICYF